MQYIPNINHKEQMLKEVGYSSIDDLFEDVPDEARCDGLKLPPGKSELEVERELNQILHKNCTLDHCPGFLGGGAYHHHVPKTVWSLAGRSEFITSYTPYQPEVSQGMLQAMFEYQSAIAELTGMDAANSSMYDWPTAIAEAAMMARRINRGSEFLIPSYVLGNKKSVIHNYVDGTGLVIKEYPYDPSSGQYDEDALLGMVGDSTAGVYVESPNLFGVIEEKVADLKAKIGKASLVIGANPLSLGILEAPGNYGADYVVGDAQVFGNPLNFGGPMVGYFACKKEHIRRMPGRIIGMSEDSRGQMAFCMTLQTREQHIRRDKATSNICSNQALAAMASSIHIYLLGKNGMRDLAQQNASRAKWLMREMNRMDGVKAPAFDSYHFNEFVVKTDEGVKAMQDRLLAGGVFAGLDISREFPDLGNASLWCTTEMHTREDYDKLLALLKEVEQ